MASFPRVCIVVDNVPPAYSGAGQQALALAHATSDVGADTVIVGKRQRGLPAHVDSDGVEIFRVNAGSAGYSPGRSLVEACRLFAKLVTLRGRYDVVLFFDPEGGFRNCWFILPLLHLMGKKTAARMTLLNASDPLTLKRKRFGSVRLIPYRLHNEIISISSGLSASYHAVFGRQGLSYIPNGVDTDRFRPLPDQDRAALRQRLGLAADKLYACFVGRISYRKGVDVIVEAWQDVVTRVPNAVLLLVGPVADSYRNVQEDEFVKTLKHSIAAAGLESHVQWVGATTDVEQYLMASDIFLFASRREGCPNAVLEAMACGLPVVATRIEGVTDDLLTSGVDGIVTEPTAGALASATVEVLTSEDRRRDLGRRARERMVQRHSMGMTAHAYLNTLGRL